MSRAVAQPHKAVSSGLLLCCILAAGSSLVHLSRQGRSLTPFDPPYFHLYRQTNFPAGQLYRFVNSQGMHMSADVASVLDIEANQPLAEAGASLQFVADGRKAVNLIFLNSKPGVLTFGIPRGYRYAPKHAWLTISSGYMRGVQKIALQPLPPAQKILTSVKPDSRVSAYRIFGGGGRRLLEVRLDSHLEPNAEAVGYVRGSTYARYQLSPLWTSDNEHPLGRDFLCDYVDDVQSLDLELAKALPQDIKADLVIPKAQLFIANNRVFLVPESYAETEVPAFGKVCADASQTPSDDNRNAHLRISYAITNRAIFSATIHYRLISPKPVDLGLVSIQLPGCSRPRGRDAERALAALGSTPVKSGLIGPITIRADIRYRTLTPWFRTQVPVIDSKRRSSARRVAYISPVNITSESIAHS